MSTKSGFSDPGAATSALLGAHGRRQVQLAAGAHGETLAGFAALTGFDDDGWRDNSPSRVRQAFTRVDWRSHGFNAGLSGLFAKNTLVGNGMVPTEDLTQRATAVFTCSPTSRAIAWTSGVCSWAWSWASTLTSHGRDTGGRVNQVSDGGDFWEEFRTAASRFAAGLPGRHQRGRRCHRCRPAGLPRSAAQRRVQHRSHGAARVGNGLAAQWRPWPAPMGAGRHAGPQPAVRFGQGQRLGFIGDDRNVELAPERYDDIGLTALKDEIPPQPVGRRGARSASLFVHDTWSPRPNLHISVGGRLNSARVTNQFAGRPPDPAVPIRRQP